MIFRDLGGLKLPDICLTGEEKPQKNLTQETWPNRGSNPSPLCDKRTCYHLLHSGGQFSFNIYRGSLIALRKFLKKYQIKTIYKPAQKLQDSLWSGKDSRDPKTCGGVYRIPCSCAQRIHWVHKKICKHQDQRTWKTLPPKRYWTVCCCSTYCDEPRTQDWIWWHSTSV